MSFKLGSVDKWTDPNSIMDPMVMIAAKAISLGANQGAFWDACEAPMDAIRTQEFEIYSRTSTSQDGTLNGALDAVATTVDVGVNASKGLSNGDVIQIEDEVMVVKKVDTSAGTVDVYSRGYAGTTAAAHAAGEAFEVITRAIKDVDAEKVESFAENTIVYNNYTQTVFEPIALTKSASVFDRKGFETSKEYIMLLAEAMKRVGADLAKSAIKGYKAAGGSAGGPSMTAGLLQQLQDDVGGTREILITNAAGAAISEAILNTAMKSVLERGQPTAMWVSPANKVVINAFNASKLQTQLSDTVAGIYVDTFIYDGYQIPVRVDSDMPDDKIAIVKQDLCYKGWVVDDGLTIADEDTNNSRVLKRSIQGSYGIGIGGVGTDAILIRNIG
jgi:hypothetical protein